MSLRNSFTANDSALWLSFDRHSRQSQSRHEQPTPISRRINARQLSTTPQNDSQNTQRALTCGTDGETTLTSVIGPGTTETVKRVLLTDNVRNVPRQSLKSNDVARAMASHDLPQTVLADSESIRNPVRSADDVLPDSVPTTLPPATAADSKSSAKEISATAIALIMLPLCLSVFLSALDLTIITPAIPTIVRSFHSTTGYVWIGSAFILASTASTPVWGSLADIWGRKPILLMALTIFLGGSLLCALAPSMHSLIVGRALQGLGSSGMGTTVNIIICDTFSLRDRGLYLAITSVVWAIGSAIGPAIGGSFATKVSWRWCFWINLPIGAVVSIVLLFSLKLPSPHTPVFAGLKAIDWVGSILIVGAALMILLGLDFGSITFPWSSVTVVCLIVFGLVTIGVFIVNEWKFAKHPVIPLRLFTKRSTVAAYFVWACNFYILIGLSYYLPLYSQSVLDANALVSGVHLVPLIVACSLSAACTGAYIQKTGTYLPITYIAHVLLCLGTGLLTSVRVGESLTKLIIFQVITGIGVGMNIEPPLIAAQAAMTVMDTAVIQATMTFIRSLATTMAVVVGGVIVRNVYVRTGCETNTDFTSTSSSRIG
jgi:MFS family permease